MKRVLGFAVSIVMMTASWPISAAGPIVNRPVGVAPAPGSIVGTAIGTNGQSLSNITVQVRNLQDGTLTGTTTSNVGGRFSFAGLNPGRYVVELASRSGPIIGSSPALEVAAGATVAVNIAGAAGLPFGGNAAQAGGGVAGGVSKAVIITAIAAGAGVATIIAIAAGGDASPSR